MRFWRNTSVASLPASGVATLPSGTLGYEWDEAPDNASPAARVVRSVDHHGQHHRRQVPARLRIDVRQRDRDPPPHDVPGTKRSARVRGGHDPVVMGPRHRTFYGKTPDVRMQQATVNLLADMGTQPTTLMTGLVAATRVSRHDATSSRRSPRRRLALAVVVGTPIVVSGTASDSGGGAIGGTEVSTDDGATWHPAVGRTSWTYAWTPTAAGPVTILARSVDDEREPAARAGQRDRERHAQLTSTVASPASISPTPTPS